MKFTIFLFTLFGPVQNDSLFINEAATFRIFQPGEFSVQKNQIYTALGSLVIETYYCEIKDPATDPNRLYLIYCMEYPQDVSADSLEFLQESVFEETLAGTAVDLNGELIYSENVQIDGYTGRVSRIEYNEGQSVVKSKMCLAGHRFYYIQVYTDKVNSLNKKMNWFLDSFRIIGK